MHLTVDAANKRIIATLDGGDPQPNKVQFTAQPMGYVTLVPSSAAQFAVDIQPHQAGVVTVTATAEDAFGNAMGSPAAVNQNVQVAGTDAETMTIASTNNPATVPASGVGTAPGVALGAGNGGGPAPTVAGVDTHGRVSFGSGAAPAAGDQVVVTFTAQRPNDNPDVTLTAGNDATQPLGLEATNITRAGFTIRTHAAPAAAQAAGTYVVEYQVAG